MARMTVRCELGDTSGERVRDVPLGEISLSTRIKTPTRSTLTLDKSKTKCFLLVVCLLSIGIWGHMFSLSCDGYSKQTN